MHRGRQRKLMHSVPLPGSVPQSNEPRMYVLPHSCERERAHLRFGAQLRKTGGRLRWFDWEWRVWTGNGISFWSG